ncbi:hypothetical protein MKX01_000051 [Papaver californicum]|nr:hypothetical protein MKX01_000051 [Papaver californicum]
MASEIHFFRKKSAMEAGNPAMYYINPSEKLMSISSEWRAYKHIINIQAYNDDDYIYIMNTDFLDVKKMTGEIKDEFSKIYIPKIKVEENKKNVVGVQVE